MESVLCKTFIAAADYSSTGQYRFVYLSAADTVTLTGAGGKPIGILQNNPASGGAANVMLMGVSRLSMSAAVAVNAWVGSAANGQGVTMSNDDEIYAAYCLEAATAANDQVKVFLPGGYHTISGSGDD